MSPAECQVQVVAAGARFVLGIVGIYYELGALYRLIGYLEYALQLQETLVALLKDEKVTALAKNRQRLYFPTGSGPVYLDQLPQKQCYAHYSLSVTLFLVQNGVFAARAGAQVPTLDASAGITVLADDLSLAERGIRGDALRDDVEVSGIDALTDLIMEDGRKPIWT